MKTKLYISILAGALALTGCSEEFLETEPTQFASADQIGEVSELNPEIQEANISGLYSTLVQMYSGGTTGHDDFGHKSYDIYSDMLTGDMILAGYTYGWFRTIVEYQTTTDYTYTDNYQVWRFYYRLVFGANNVIDQLGGNDAVPELEAGQHYMGQAKAIRGFAYFYLANYFGEGYDPSAPLVPLYTEPSVEAQALSTTAEVYAQVESDLTDAVELLEGFSRTDKNQIDQNVAKGLLAYAYAAQQKYTEVQPLAQDLVDAYPLTPADRVVYNGENAEQAGFNDVGDPAWIWGQDLTLDLGLDLVSWWGVVDLFTYSYAWAGDPKSINADLYEAIPEEDVRKGQFVDAYGSGVLYPINKFYGEDRRVAGQREVTTDYVYMRAAEFYLLLAESAYHNDDEATAKQALKDLLTERVPDPSYVDALSGQALMDEIYLQTRIELWGEGKIYLAMKRNEKTITLPENHLSLPGNTYEYTADELTFEIPSQEIQNNPFIER